MITVENWILKDYKPRLELINEEARDFYLGVKRRALKILKEDSTNQGLDRFSLKALYRYMKNDTEIVTEDHFSPFIDTEYKVSVLQCRFRDKLVQMKRGAVYGTVEGLVDPWDKFIVVLCIYYPSKDNAKSLPPIAVLAIEELDYYNEMVSTPMIEGQHWINQRFSGRYYKGVFCQDYIPDYVFQKFLAIGLYSCLGYIFNTERDSLDCGNSIEHLAPVLEDGYKKLLRNTKSPIRLSFGYGKMSRRFEVNLKKDH